jgi:hypothetical protein
LLHGWPAVIGKLKGPVVPPQPSRIRVTCQFGHVIKTRMPPGTQLPCSPCGQEGRKDITVTVPAPLPAIRPETHQGTPGDIAVITRRKTGPERWHCAGCLGSVITPAPGEPPLGWIEVRAGVPTVDGGQAVHELVARACSAECLAKTLPLVRDWLDGRPWQAPDPGPDGNVAALMRQAPRRRG